MRQCPHSKYSLLPLKGGSTIVIRFLKKRKWIAQRKGLAFLFASLCNTSTYLKLTAPTYFMRRSATLNLST